MDRLRTDAEELLAHAGWAQRVAMEILRDPSQAEDLAQDTVEARLRTESPVDSEPGWFAAVARRLTLQSLRSRKRRERRESAERELPESLGPDKVVEKIEAHRALSEAVLRLPEKSRVAIVLRYYDELPIHEVADRLGIHSKAAEARIYRALRSLRHDLATRLGEHWATALLPLGFPSAAPLLPPILAMSTTSKTLVAAAILLVIAIPTAILLETSDRGEGHTDLQREALDGEQGAQVAGTAPATTNQSGPGDLVARREEVRPSGRSVRLRVVDSDGQAVAAARVDAYWTPGETERTPDFYIFWPDFLESNSPAASEESDARGDVEVAFPEDLDCAALFVSADGFQRRCVTWVLEADAVIQDLGEVTLAPGADLAVELRSEAGDPIPHAKVGWFSDLGDSPAGTLRAQQGATDDSGRLAFHGILPGPGRISISHPAYVNQSAEISPSQGETLDLALTLSGGESATLAVLTPDGEAVKGAEVYIEEWEQQLASSRFSPAAPEFLGRTDAAGTIAVTGIPEGVHVTATVMRDGSWAVASRVVPGEVRTISLPDARSVTLSCVWPDGSPASGVAVEIWDTNRGSQTPERSSEADAEGSVRLVLPDGAFGVALWHPQAINLREIPLAVGPGMEDVEITMTRTALVSLRCIERGSGEPVRPDRVRLVRDRSGTKFADPTRWMDDASRRYWSYSKSGLREGEASLRMWTGRPFVARITAAGYLPAHLPIDPAQLPADRVVEFVPSCELVLTLVDHEGNPVVGRQVELSPEGYDNSWMMGRGERPVALPVSRATDSAGRVRYPALAVGVWEIGLGFQSVLQEGAIARIELGPGLNEREVRLPMQPQLTVHVTQGVRPVEGAEVRTRLVTDARFADGARSRDSRTDATGKLVLSLSRPGRCQVSVYREGFFPEVLQIDLVAEQERLDVDLAAGGVVSGRVAGGDATGFVWLYRPRPESDHAVRGIADHMRSPDGYISGDGSAAMIYPLDASAGFRIEGLAEGTYWIAAFGPNHVDGVPRRIEVGSGELTCDLQLERAGSVVLNVFGMPAFRESHPGEVLSAYVEIDGVEYRAVGHWIEEDAEVRFPPLPCRSGELIVEAISESRFRELGRLAVQPRAGEVATLEWRADQRP